MKWLELFNKWLAMMLGNTLSSMAFFYFCVILDLFELGPVIQAHSVIIWCNYISQTVIQLIALPILGVMQKLGNDHHKKTHSYHKQHDKKLDQILAHLSTKPHTPVRSARYNKRHGGTRQQRKGREK